MKTFRLPVLLIAITLATACQKDDITPAKPTAKQQIIECRMCTGSWDITDSIP